MDQVTMAAAVCQTKEALTTGNAVYGIDRDQLVAYVMVSLFSVSDDVLHDILWHACESRKMQEIIHAIVNEFGELK